MHGVVQSNKMVKVSRLTIVSVICHPWYLWVTGEMLVYSELLEFWQNVSGISFLFHSSLFDYTQ